MVAVMKHRGDKACVATVVDASLVLAARGSSGTPGSRMGFSAYDPYLVALAGRANGLSPLYRTRDACETTPLPQGSRSAFSRWGPGEPQSSSMAASAWPSFIVDHRRCR